MRIFDSLKTLNFYHEVYTSLSDEQKTAFEKGIKELFDKKSVSEEGEYDTFKITERDIAEMADKVK